MCNSMVYQITNIKVSLKINPLCLSSVQKELKSQNIPFSTYTNFIVVRKIFTYIIFKTGTQKNNHVNITKINSESAIITAIEILQTLLTNVVIQKQTVDNITASTNLHKPILLTHLPNIYRNIDCIISYNPEKFPGLFIKVKNGTIIIFHTGKCIIIGAKTLNDIECLILRLALI